MKSASRELYIQLLKEGFPSPRTEHVFHPGRRFRFDIAWPELFLAVEVEGGIFGKGERCPTCGQSKRGAHGSISGILRDIEKYNLAQMDGWTVLRVLPGSKRAVPIVGKWFSRSGWHKDGTRWIGPTDTRIGR